MSDYEFEVLSQYQLKTPFPTEWPADKDLSDESDNEENEHAPNLPQKSKPRYSALIRAAGNRKSVARTSQRADYTLENLLQRDEPDPLGSTDSVVGKLKNLGLPVQDNIRLRNKFLLSSTTFSPSLFLSQVHSSATTQDLLEGLEILSQSIDQKSASLKVLVESNFERFVRAKATIDNVYKEMRYRGEEPVPNLTRPRNHSRHASRNSFRTTSNNQVSSPNHVSDMKKKNALLKESEYGVLGIKSYLLDVSAKAEEVWGPALGGHEKESNLRLMTTSMEQFKELYQVSGSLSESIKRKDYEAILEDYTKAKRFAHDAKKLSEKLSTTTASDLQIFQILLAAHVWSDVLELVEDLKRDIWRKLLTIQSSSSRRDIGSDNGQDQHMDHIEILLELGVSENPIWIWLSNRYNSLKSKILSTSNQYKAEIEILRRRLANTEKPTTPVIASHLKSLRRHLTETKLMTIDTPGIVELWERVSSYVSILMSTPGILGEVVELWQAMQSFINGPAKKRLMTNLNKDTLQNQQLSKIELSELRKGILELVNIIRESISDLFFKEPVDDISSLLSPLLLTPRTPAYPSRLSPTLNAFQDFNANQDSNILPPPSIKRGEAWEKFAFWPPWSNSLSALYYLAKMLAHIGSGANEMGAVFSEEPEFELSKEQLKSFVSGIRERCVNAFCAAWNKDADDMKMLEDWKRSPENRNLTNMPMYYGLFGNAVLTGMQKILYIPEASTKRDSVNVVSPPPAKLLQVVRSQFVSTLYKSLAGLVENAEQSVTKPDDVWTPDINSLASSTQMANAINMDIGTANSRERNVRMLLTLSNMQALFNDVVPNMVAQLENAFAVKLTDETNIIRDVLNQIDARLFSSYTQPFVETLRNNIRVGITSSPQALIEKPNDVRPYVYEVLLSLVLLHSQVSTTAGSLTSKILSYLLEQISEELLESLKLRSQWSLPDLMQATLDVEFISQTLIQYNTDSASKIQGLIYQELDKGTDNTSRAELQTELPDMRTVLKRLRDKSRNEFVCFKKSRNRTEKSRALSLTSEQQVY
ncbi:Exocyst complex component SEC5 [Erysiphe neolycopersici]|uniref:Exocyst complex component SEC5 n=1 Tax=Erysiphe neolycopersici TaxID=212602 RepID=A0A420I3I1_9PEZI|nr:Exocyst complex component SEC5 [Erysiphe neolycopersici]